MAIPARVESIAALGVQRRNESPTKAPHDSNIALRTQAKSPADQNESRQIDRTESNKAVTVLNYYSVTTLSPSTFSNNQDDDSRA